MMKMKRFLNILGPGLLYAGAAVGVSHLVQSTRAGADFGFGLVWIIVIANVVKYPFFEFAPRYATSTGKNLIDGYADLGKWALWLFALLTVSTMFSIIAAVTAVTTGLFAFVLNISLSPSYIFILVIAAIMLLLIIGRYSILDHVIKFVIILLALSTFIAVIIGFENGYHPDPQKAQYFSFLIPANIFFLIALIGWMPAPIDVSVWHSLWSLEKQKSSKERITLKQSLLDFRIGYIGTTILAACFLSMGALVMHGTGESLSPLGAVFAGQFIGMYTASLGSWTYSIITIAALTTMVSTTLTALDAYSRVIQNLVVRIISTASDLKRNKSIYRIALFVLGMGSILVYVFMAASMRLMVDIATTLSFITAPILAILNHKVMHSAGVPADAKPPQWLSTYSIIGIILLSCFTLFYVFWNIFY